MWLGQTRILRRSPIPLGSLLGVWVSRHVHAFALIPLNPSTPTRAPKSWTQLRGTPPPPPPPPPPSGPLVSVYPYFYQTQAEIKHPDLAKRERDTTPPSPSPPPPPLPRIRIWPRERGGGGGGGIIAFCPRAPNTLAASLHQHPEISAEHPCVLICHNTPWAVTS